mmetsp:Transcript_8476/g.15561  ORF Transcript_8476/g.15561 Transcript_8476/m.15561 type:complete len:263 (+) Transcript_8476:41-829(+)
MKERTPSNNPALSETNLVLSFWSSTVDVFAASAVSQFESSSFARKISAFSARNSSISMVIALWFCRRCSTKVPSNFALLTCKEAIRFATSLKASIWNDDWPSLIELQTDLSFADISARALCILAFSFAAVLRWFSARIRVITSPTPPSSSSSSSSSPSPSPSSSTSSSSSSPTSSSISASASLSLEFNLTSSSWLLENSLSSDSEVSSAESSAESSSDDSISSESDSSKPRGLYLPTLEARAKSDAVSKKYWWASSTELWSS